MSEIAYLNGRFMPIEEAMVPIEDRGYQFGDAVYEFLDSYKGRLFCLEAHLDRLEKSLRALRFPPVSRDELRADIVELFKRGGFQRAGIYLQISRGVEPRSHIYGDHLSVQTVMTIRDIEHAIPERVRAGMRVQCCEDFRWGCCNVKTVQLLPAVLARREAVDRGMDDTIFISPEGIVREGTSWNVFMVKDGVVRTHPESTHILSGITRGVVLELCGELDIRADEQFFDREALVNADEIFATGTVMGVIPIVEVDGRGIGDRTCGSVTERIKTAFYQKANE